MTNVMMKTCLNQIISNLIQAMKNSVCPESESYAKAEISESRIKISNLIQAMKSSVRPKAKVIRRPKFSESRICQNIYRMFRSVD